VGKITKSRVDSQGDDLEQDGIKTLTPEEAAEVKKKNCAHFPSGK